MSVDECKQVRAFSAVQDNELSADSEAEIPPCPQNAWVAQLVERIHGKDEVTGSIPVSGSGKI